MNADNPYSTPLAQPESPTQLNSRESLGAIARTTFLAWEKLRVLYVGWLVVVTLTFGVAKLSDFEFWLAVVAGAIFVNLCYFAGPVIETYVTWLGHRGKWLRVTLFVVGTVVASSLAAIGAMTFTAPQ